ncbi:MAG: universal stress protein [Deltaproteobacteria bacterium]|nr:universal stress protein [Deltaproteobacteria bacterium]
MKKVLIPTDFTPAARRALHFGVSIFETSGVGAKLILVHTFPFLVNASNSWVEVHDEWKRNSAKSFADVLEEARRIYSPKHVSFETLSFIGSLGNVLVHLVRDRGIDCVIWGTDPESGKEEEIARVLSRVSCPLVVVPF